jgi:DNA (cytosine-5)-methyltransferase 1
MCKPRLLDLFCCAGGAAMGYHRAGFDVVGVDINPQPRYPFAFVQGDALEYVAAHGHEFDAIHASPPCQAYSVTKSLTTKAHPELVPQTRALLRATGKPYVIENVPGAPLVDALTLCGTMFGLDVIRHRLFECSHPIYFPPATCAHAGKTANGRSLRAKGITRNPTQADGFRFITVTGHGYNVTDGRQAMGIDWMTQAELSQAIPPAYTEYIGHYLMGVLV